MSATNGPLLRELGLADAIGAEAGPEIRRVALFAGDAIVPARMPRTPGPDGWGRAIGRERLDTALLAHARQAGVSVWQPWSAAALRREGAGHVVTLGTKSDSREIAAPLVVAAHGSWERGELPTQPAKRNRPGDLLGFKAHFSGGRLEPDLMPLLVFPGGYGGMVTSDRGRVSLTGCIRRDVLERARARFGAGSAAEAVHRHLVASCRGIAQALEGATLDGRWLAAGPLNPGIRPHHNGGVFAAGNVAGEAHPIIAEGISMALQSGWLLAHHLIAAEARSGRPDAIAAAAAGYGSAWRGLFAGRIRAASVFAGLALRPEAVALLLPVLRAFPRLLTVGADLSGKRRLASAVMPFHVQAAGPL
jgi:2-polyprenyl-6-methoxyphenol hydroxylase-like FAD-dependent oxidoreductase